jgi:hypothetical protein
LDERTLECRRLQTEELYDLHCAANVIRVINARRMRRVRQVAGAGEREEAHRLLGGEREGKISFGRQYLDNIKTDLQEV